MKVALITGGSNGIGKCLCLRLAAQNYKVAILDIDENSGLELCDSLNRTYGKGTGLFSKCDVSNETSYKQSFDAAIREWGRIDLVVNNAGVWNDSPTGWRHSIDININGVIAGSLLAIKYMGKNNGGKGGIVINIASVLSFTTYPVMPIYGATKAAVLKITRDLGTEDHFNLHGVKFIAMCPNGVADSKFFKEDEKKLLFNNDENFIKMYNKLDKTKFQKADNVAKAIMVCLGKEENGSVWIVENETGGRQIDIPEIEIMKF